MHSQSDSGPCGIPEKEHSLLDHLLNPGQWSANPPALTTLRPQGAYQVGMWGMSKVPALLTPARPCFCPSRRVPELKLL